jgi:Isoleucyl-tRNA synthetase
LNQAAKVFAYVLANLAKISAPFIPFLSEEIYQGLAGFDYTKARSVHLEVWPQIPMEKTADKDLGRQMERVRELTAAVLAERAKHGVKVRQPLAKLIVGPSFAKATGGEGVKLSNELRDLLAGEVNVKTVEFDSRLETPIEIDWNVTPELKEEGNIRETMRQIQELRKTAKFTPADKIIIYILAEGGLKAAIEKNRSMIARETKAAGIEFKSRPDLPRKSMPKWITSRYGWA